MSKVIVFTCAYNAEKTITRTIESVINQTYGNIAYYIVDNGSTDATGDIISAYASSDERIYKISIFENDLKYYSVMFSLLRRCHRRDAEWITIIDADDTWTVDYLEKMVGFAEVNDLPFVMCGYDQIDDKTGKILKHRVAPAPLIICREDYVDQYINFRGFTLAMWGKLYRLEDFGDGAYMFSSNYYMYGDTRGIYKILNYLNRFGVYPEAMYNYYIHENAYTFNSIDEVVENFEDLYGISRGFLKNQGEISNLNQNFLYAIYLTSVQDTVSLVLRSSLSQPNKLALISKIFYKPLLHEVFKFKNIDQTINKMVTREEVIDDVVGAIGSLNIKNEYRIMYERILAEYRILKGYLSSNT